MKGLTHSLSDRNVMLALNAVPLNARLSSLYVRPPTSKYSHELSIKYEIKLPKLGNTYQIADFREIVV